MQYVSIVQAISYILHELLSKTIEAGVCLSLRSSALSVNANSWVSRAIPWKCVT